MGFSRCGDRVASPETTTRVISPLSAKYLGGSSDKSGSEILASFVEDGASKDLIKIQDHPWANLLRGQRLLDQDIRMWDQQGLFSLQGASCQKSYLRWWRLF